MRVVYVDVEVTFEDNRGQFLYGFSECDSDVYDCIAQQFYAQLMGWA